MTRALSGPFYTLRVVSMLLVGWMLGACAEQQVRDDAQQFLRVGAYEQAVVGLETGLKEHPQSALLRAGLIQAQSEAFARLLSEATTARAEGRYADAEATLNRAKRFEGSSKRVDSLLADLRTEQRQRRTLAEAEGLAGRQQTAAALVLLAEALKDNPRQPDLLALQRKLEMLTRQAQVQAAQVGLAETRPISLDFRDASLRTVLDVVTRHSGINFILDPDVRPDVRVTVFLRAAPVQDAIDLITSTHGLAKKIVDSRTLLIYPKTPEKQRQHEEQVIRVFYLASADAKGAASFLRSMLRVKEPFVDERSNMLALREAPETIALAERLLALYDSPDPEVLLELEVIEVRTSRLTELGIKFPDTLSLTLLPPTGQTGLTLDNVRNFGRDRVAVGIGGLLLNFKREVGDFHTLANPRVRARNKEKARILIGDKLPIVTTTTGIGGFVSDSVSYIDVGLKLDVEPTVYADDDVAIRVGLEVSSLSREVRTTSGTLAYQIGTRNANTLLRLRDGETQLLAGLISRDERSSASRLPGLGDLPVAGRLFSNQSDDTQRTELVLAITPRIVRNLRQPDASEAELWVGTEAATRLRAVGGRIAEVAAPATVASSPTAGPSEFPAPALSTVSTDGEGEASAPIASKVSLQWQGPTQVKAGEEFTVNLALDSQVALRGSPVQIMFDASRLQMQSISEGDYFRKDGARTSFSHSSDAPNGQVNAGVLRGQATGARGQGSIVSLRMKALARGATAVSLASFEPITLAGESPDVALPPPLAIEVQ